jgi:hypothetical protein
MLAGALAHLHCGEIVLPLDPEPKSSDCKEGITVTNDGADLPAEIVGHYDEAFDCTLEEIGPWFGGVDYAHCFRKDDGSAWRIWNSGCGWCIGAPVQSEFDSEMPFWASFVRTYAGLCAEIPLEQLGVEALKTDVFFDDWGEPIVGLSASAC